MRPLSSSNHQSLLQILAEKALLIKEMDCQQVKDVSLTWAECMCERKTVHVNPHILTTLARKIRSTCRLHTLFNSLCFIDIDLKPVLSKQYLFRCTATHLWGRKQVCWSNCSIKRAEISVYLIYTQRLLRYNLYFIWLQICQQVIVSLFSSGWTML